MVDKIPVTSKAFDKIQQELRWRQQEERPRIIKAISEARAYGDLSENAEYQAAKELQNLNEGRMAELENIITRAEVIDISTMSGDRIAFGATVSLVEKNSGDKKNYQIVGDQEADVQSGLVSISSPIARALIGKELGDIISVNAPGGEKTYEILQVLWI
ncbi:transcription elongation factor GreA [Candidatus Liberibacter asiaticus]|uniref:transcription elongation factor GreA n=1 Tax=Liberibacter asiaticus TaxID=34021 RepID=UPI0023491998|nr:transcription elongation factor GreA [Candidatus Liberibacter asiaticus]WCM57699.1 transcription elongation factor GreA [Candidatus Liberibacter asiaticus]